MPICYFIYYYLLGPPIPPWMHTNSCTWLPLPRHGGAVVCRCKFWTETPLSVFKLTYLEQAVLKQNGNPSCNNWRRVVLRHFQEDSQVRSQQCGVWVDTSHGVQGGLNGGAIEAHYDHKCSKPTQNYRIKICRTLVHVSGYVVKPFLCCVCVCVQS